MQSGSELKDKHVSQENDMRDVYEVLRARESLIEQLRREVEALRLVAPLLNDDRDNGSLADGTRNEMESDARNVRSIENIEGQHLSKQSDRESTVPDEEPVGAAQTISGRLRRLARPVLDAVNSMAG
jgi:hypothetical protein